MKSIFHAAVQTELLTRISQLDKTSHAHWGKMNLYQAAKHCTIWNEWVLGTNNPVYKQMFIGKILGRMMLKSSVKNDKPFDQNVPAGSAFVIKETSGDLELQLATCKMRIREYSQFSNPDFIHDFFGKMTREEIGIFCYKHNDHHLRQFGA